MRTAALLLAVLAAVPLGTTAVIYAAARRRGETGTDPLGGSAAVRAFLVECAATLVALLAMPFRLRPVATPGSRGVALLVPELRSSSAGFWYLARRLRRAGWTVLAAAEHPVAAGTDAIAAALDTRVALVPPGLDVAIVGHGYGGVLAVRYAELAPERVRHVVTLGTPHQGSRGLVYRLLGVRTPPGSPSQSVRDVTAIYSDFDAWLVPVDDAYRPGAFNIAVRGVGHWAMLWSRRVADLLVENLAASPSGPIS